MAQIRGFIASSLDGYIASADGGIDWLDEFSKLDYGYDEFIAQIGTVVVGRRTFDQVQELIGWPYSGQRAIIVTHRTVDELPDDGEVFDGDIAQLIARLRKTAERDVWVIGGSSVQHQFLEAGGLDRIEVHVIPVLLGEGIPLWLPASRRRRLQLNAADTLDGGMVRLDYSFPSAHS